MDIDSLVFLDESSIDTGMTRLYGRAASNERVTDCTPDTRLERTTVLSSIRASGDTVPLIFEGSLNGELFREYITQCLVPTLKTGDIAVMDNLSSHKAEGIMEPVIAAGATVRYLPPYSPDLNPLR
jgi:hypothetical protein